MPRTMGGLVSHWFIEREGGHEVVAKLVMPGTPNGGSPWPTFQDYAGTLLTFELNAVTTVAWPAKVFGTLVAALEKVDTALDQVRPSGAVCNRIIHVSCSGG